MTLQKNILDAEQIFTIPDFLSEEECARFIALSESLGYDDAPITTAAGFVMRKDVRDNLRVMHDDVELAAQWFALLQPFMPAKRLIWDVCGLNERFRFYRYDVGQKFDLHYDGCFRRSDVEESLYTFMIYLNDDFVGGETNFYLQNGRLRLSVKPEKGKALLFWHAQLHEGAPVRTGRKYVVRSDVMYRQTRAGE
jgi:predicted 2-oxoglutarate/Fe(II)-dependent dioxygenase YbiX